MMTKKELYFGTIWVVSIMSYACGSTQENTDTSSDSGAIADSSRIAFDASIVDANNRYIDSTSGSTSDEDDGGSLVTVDSSYLSVPDAVIDRIKNKEDLPQEAWCDAEPTESGVGLECTRRGGECPSELICTAAFRGEKGICTKLGCGITPDDCGSDAACCTLLEAGGVSLCFPDACRPTACMEDF